MKRASVAALSAFILALIIPQPVFSQTPTSQPAPAPYVLITPPLMEKETIDGHVAFCPLELVKTVTAGLHKIKPAARPTTTPSDLVARLDQVRPELLKDMSADLLIPQDKVAAFLDGKLKTMLSELTAIKPHLFLLVCNQEQLDALTKSGWTAPLFYYNHLAQTTIYTPRITVPLDRAMDDVVMWCEVKPNEKDSDIADAVANQIQTFENSFPQSTFTDALLQMRNLMVNFIGENAINPLKLKPTEDWFGLGVIADMSAKYAAEMTGLSRADMAASLAQDVPQQNPIKAGPLDVLHGFEPGDIKPEFLAYYRDAMSRKGAAAVQKMLNKAGDAALPKILSDIKSNPPADNDALVKLIQTDSGVDLTNDLLPQ
jgi:hypothetical protein